MKLPDYVTPAEVKRVCRALRIRDWTKIKKPQVPLKEAGIILKQIEAKGMKINLEQFRKGLEVELEHGTMFGKFNVTNNHPVLTGKIVMAHFMETLDYYKRLDVAELEGDLLKALVRKDMKKAISKYRKLADARTVLSRSEAGEIK